MAGGRGNTNKSRLAWVAFVVSVVVLASVSTLFVSVVLSHANQHRPLLLIGDASFTRENGVRSGSGSESNPFIIEHWKIDMGKFDGEAIQIKYTRVHFEVKNITILGHDNHLGIYIVDSTNGTIRDCKFESVTWGITAVKCQNVSFVGNRFVRATYGSMFEECVNCRLEGNEYPRAFSEQDGIISATFDDCRLFNITGNAFDSGGIEILDAKPGNLTALAITDNTVGGYAIRCFVDETSLSLNHLTLGQLLLLNCTHVGVSDITTPPSVAGLVMRWCENVNVSGCDFPGINADSCNDFSIYCCTLAQGQLISTGCSRFEVDSNSLSGSPGGMSFWEVDNFTLSGNVIKNTSSWGLLFQSADNGTVVGNTIERCAQGISVDTSTSAKIYHNNLINNTQQAAAFDFTYGMNIHAIKWDDGYPGGGNFWSDSDLVDNFRGVDQDIPGPDGIVDHPYEIANGNSDRYPLVAEFAP